jgi:signal transduction histidine kinase/CheY-like chemotaxis protein
MELIAARLLATTPELVFVYDLAAGRASAGAGAVAALLGAASADGAPVIPDRVHPDDLAATLAALAEAAALPEGAAREHRLRLRHHDGRWRRFAARLTPLAVGADRASAAAVLGVARDVTDEDAALEARTASASRVAGRIGHDFNNVLTVIRANVEMLLATANEEDAELLGEVMATADRGVMLTRKLQAVGRREPLRLEPVSLRALLASTQGTVAGLLQGQATLTVSQPEDVWAIADRVDLELLVMLLGAHAATVARVGGEVRLAIATRDEGTAPATSAGPLAAGRWAVIELVDGGPGGPGDPRRTAELLEAGATSGPEAAQPTIARILARAGGGLTVAAGDAGATLTCYLPIGRPKGERPSRRALVVDEDSASRAATCAALRRHGFAVDGVADADAARAALATPGPTPFEVVLSDAAVPGMTEAARTAGDGRGAPLRLVMSALSKAELRRKGLIEGDAPVLAKPLEVPALLAAIAAARPPA